MILFQEELKVAEDSLSGRTQGSRNMEKQPVSTWCMEPEYAPSPSELMADKLAEKFHDQVRLVVHSDKRKKGGSLDEGNSQAEASKTIPNSTIRDLMCIWPFFLSWAYDEDVSAGKIDRFDIVYPKNIDLSAEDLLFYTLQRVINQEGYPDSAGSRKLEIIKLIGFWGDSRVLYEILEYFYEDCDYTYHYLLEALNYLGIDHPIVDNMLKFIKTKDDFDIERGKSLLRDRVPEGDRFTIPDLINVAYQLYLRDDYYYQDDWHFDPFEALTPN